MNLSNETIRYIAFGCLFAVTAGVALGAHAMGCPPVMNAAIAALGTCVGFFLGKAGGSNGITKSLCVAALGVSMGLGALSSSGCNKVRLDPVCAANAAMKCAAELAACCTVNPEGKGCVEALKGGK